MLLNRVSLFILIAVVLFVIAFLIAVGVITANYAAFVAAGLACFALGHLP